METRDYPVPDLPNSFPNLPPRGSVQNAWNRKHIVIDEPGHYDTIWAANGTIEFNTKGGDLYVRTKTLKLSGGPGEVTVTGGGRLYLYVEQSLDFSGTSRFNAAGDPMAAVIYYPSSTHLVLSNNIAFRGIIYVKDADVTIGSSFSDQEWLFPEGGQAWIFSGGTSVTIEGNAKLGPRGIVYAPRAHVKVRNSAQAAAVIANSVELTGNPRITYQDINFDRLPLEFASDPTKGVVESLEWQLCWTDCLTVN